MAFEDARRRRRRRDRVFSAGGLVLLGGVIASHAYSTAPGPPSGRRPRVRPRAASDDELIEEQFRWRRLATPLAEARGLFVGAPTGGLARGDHEDAASSSSSRRRLGATAKASDDEEEATAVAIIDSVFAGDASQRARSLAALRADPAAVLATRRGVLSPVECAALRAYCDTRVDADLALDNVDRLPDFQVNVDVETLRGVIGSQTVDRLLALPDALLSSRRDDDSSKNSPPRSFARVGVFVRRYTPATRPYFPWHCDGNAFTANLALSPAGAHRGGQLRCLVGRRVATLDRGEGDATVHTNDVCHAVAPVDAGRRYSMLMFFHNAARREG
mmetsp:Transcript_16721/g.67444  ORF Transcript_16721/g.67444 Transcript_16721/m.67444 type:complete len:331 (+) Transcript_16721:47-1039(+)|eukprot:CAMPEP_0185719058 /NCGR_PEP_ID=MMETSP1164-20130828/47986_1 /TAXON_ID=1104430 /ORGANISM="Chrysoreinhardia sp, Strain CCMP2950" /LENGTH=330 /DNA_ID=CAMNT_0028386709 /DNA_START=30 /DNA_END=1022 /DNA_ORIENTATION=-